MYSMHGVQLKQTFTPGARKTILLPVLTSSSDNGLQSTTSDTLKLITSSNTGGEVPSMKSHTNVNFMPNGL